MKQMKNCTETTEKMEEGILRWVINQICQQYFAGSCRETASVFGLPLGTVERVLEAEKTRAGVAVFEQAMKYCMANHISMDDLLRQFQNKQSEGE